MNTIKKLALVCAFAFPAAAFAGGSATGTITEILVDASFANVVYVTVSGLKVGNPACSTSARGQFVIPITVVVDYESMFEIAKVAAINGSSVTITGQNMCNVDNQVETIQNIKIG